MSTELVPLPEFLAAITRGQVKDYDPAVPRLGTAGRQLLGKHPSGYAVLRDLSADEYVRFTEAAKRLGRFGAARQVIGIAKRNAGEFDASLAQAVQEYAADTALTWERANELVIVLNQRLLNFLTSMRTYLDHAETRLKRRHGKQSSEAEEFRTATTVEFDAHFAYRFMYKLRNYTQHCGMPLGKITANSSLPTPQPGGPADHRIDFYFVRDELLANNGFQEEWGRIVTPELQALPPLFPLSAYVSQVTESLQHIDGVVTEIDKRELSAAIQFLSELRAEVDGAEGTPCVYDKIACASESPTWSSNVNFTRLPVEVLDQLSHRSQGKPS